MSQSFLRLFAVGSMSTLSLVLTPVSAVAAEQVEVAVELARLSKTHGFAVRGLEQTEASLGRAEGEDLYPRLRRLLENFDHVIVQGPSGGIDRVIVLGEKVPFEPLPSATPPSAADGGDIVIETKRRGNQHLVRVSLEGKSGAKIEHELQVDTGADFLVLPLSLASKLGIDSDALDERDIQTANGKVQARIGTLPSVWLGASRIGNIETAFLDDNKLGARGLLGMSVLKRYKLTIDDEDNRITLSKKQGGDAATESGASRDRSAGADKD